jgi:DNA-binding response OmpR family regulator
MQSIVRPKTILLIDDDQVFWNALADQIDHADGLTCIQVGTAAEGLRQAKAGGCDAILLDVGGVGLPVIMLTAADSEADIILGLESGANDYVTKPFRIDVLVARLRAHLRQHERSEDAVMTIGPYEFQPAARLLAEKSGKKIRLTRKEASILRCLSGAGGNTVTRAVLLREVWGYIASIPTHTVETHIYRLGIRSRRTRRLRDS